MEGGGEHPALAVALRAERPDGGAVPPGPLAQPALAVPSHTVPWCIQRGGDGISRLSPKLLERISQGWMFLCGVHTGELGEVGPGFPDHQPLKAICEADGFGMGIRGLP